MYCIATMKAEHGVLRYTLIIQGNRTHTIWLLQVLFSTDGR